MKKKSQSKSNIERKSTSTAKSGLQQEGSNAGSRPWLKRFAWKKGVSGNPSGKRAGSVSVTAALKKMIAEGSTADQVAKAIIDGVITKRDPQFAKILLDRVDGTLAERLQAHVSGTFIGPVAAPAEVVIVLPSNGREGNYPNDAAIAVQSAHALPPAKAVIEVAAEQEEKSQVKPVPARPLQIEPPPKIHESNLTALKPSGPNFSGFGG